MYLVDSGRDRPYLAELLDVFASIVGHADTLGQAILDELFHSFPVLGEARGSELKSAPASRLYIRMAHGRDLISANLSP